MVTDHKIFLKAPLAPIYTNFKGGAQVFGQNFPKSDSKRLFLPMAQKFWPKKCLFSAVAELGKSIWLT